MAMASTLRSAVLPFPSSPAGNAAGLYLARLAAGSRPTMRWALGVVARELPLPLGGRDPLAVDWARVGYAEVVQMRAGLARYSPASANLILAALRGVLREAWRLGQMSVDDYHRAVDVPAVRGRSAPAGRALEEAEIAALLGACVEDPTPAGARDAAMLAILVATGLRRAELAALELADYDAKSGTLRVRSGKGRKGRVVYASAATELLGRWIAERSAEPGRLFVRLWRGGGRLGKSLTGDGVRRILLRRAAQAGLRAFSPHDLRRTWLSGMLDAGADLAAAQGLAGHADPKTTAGYDRRGERARQRAAGLVRLPNPSPSPSPFGDGRGHAERHDE